jgi:hypothetical protein
MFRRVLESGESIRDVEIEGSTRAAPGVVRYWLGSYHPLKDELGRPRAISMVIKEITELKQRELQLEQRLRFERLLADTCARLADSDPDETLQGLLSELGKGLSVDVVEVVQFVDSGTELRVTKLWASDPPTVQSDRLPEIIVNEHFPWLTEKMLRGEIVRILQPSDFEHGGEFGHLRPHESPRRVSRFSGAGLFFGARTLGGRYGPASTNSRRRYR